MSFIDHIAHSDQNSLLSVEGNASKGRLGGIERVSAVGILANAALAATKFTIGTITNSIAITSDAVNNLSDALSSTITVFGMKLSGKRPDHMHPYGYGRIEYLATLVIGALILASGISTLFEAIENIVQPEETSYTPVLLVVLGCTIAVKLALGLYYRRRGKDLGSDALTASGKEALLDVLVTLATIVAALISMIWGVSTEPFFATAISVLVIKTGVGVLTGAGSKVLGKRPDADLAGRVRAAAESVEKVRRACNLRLVDYGPRPCTAASTSRWTSA